MDFPSVADTIIAVSSGWEARPVGIVRLSGPESFALVRTLGVVPAAAQARPQWTAARLRLEGDESTPAAVLWFREPRSYTGQDLVELHTVGCLPLLRELCGRLIELGARRALPGEFTARAFLLGKLDAEQVEDVLTLIHADNEAAVRQAGRARDEYRRIAGDLRERIADLLARIEAGIDFSDEEDVRFITPTEVIAALDGMLQTLATFRERQQVEPGLGKPHVALAGLPNAGKSTLFNVLVGSERAIVSPVLGTTRDVLSAEIEVSGVPIVLQDCAGLGRDADELELAAHLAAEKAADQADLVLWVHGADTPWASGEAQVAARIPPERRLLVWSKMDLSKAGRTLAVPGDLREVLRVSAATGSGLPELCEAVCRRLSRRAATASVGLFGQEFRALSVALGRARDLVDVRAEDLLHPELVALELRAAREGLSEAGSGGLVEELLGRVFSRFCIGK